VAETWRRVWGDGKIFRPFLVIDQVFRIFPLFSLIFRIFTLLNIVHNPFLTRKTPFFTVFILSRTSDNTTSQNIRETNAWAVPHLKLWGSVPSVPPRFPPLDEFYVTFQLSTNTVEAVRITEDFENGRCAHLNLMPERRRRRNVCKLWQFGQTEE